MKEVKPVIKQESKAIKSKLKEVTQTLAQADVKAKKAVEDESRAQRLYRAMQDLYREAVESDSKNKKLVEELERTKELLSQSVETVKETSKAVKGYKAEVEALKALVSKNVENVSQAVTGATVAQATSSNALDKSSKALEKATLTFARVSDYKDKELAGEVEALKTELAKLSAKVAETDEANVEDVAGLYNKVAYLTAKVDDLLGLGTSLASIKRTVSKLVKNSGEG